MKTKTGKRLLSIIMVCAMIISMLPTVALANDVETSTTDVASINGQGYESLAAAVAAVEDNGTIVLNQDASGSGIGTFLNTANSTKNAVKNFTIDFNNHTYTCTGPAVGSSGTQSQAFHLEWKGSGNDNAKVTLKNGTITSTANSGVRMLVQNYCDLTIENMTLDGTNIGTGQYTLSNNCGNVLIKNSTIIAPTNGYAFDACDYSTYTGVTVTVEGNSSIRGTVECVNYNGGDNNAKIVLKGGTFTNGKVNTDYNGATAELSSYVASGYSLVSNASGTYTVAVDSSSNLEAAADSNGTTADAVVSGSLGAGGNSTGDNVDTDGGNNTLTIDATTGKGSETANNSVTTSNVTITSDAMTSVNEAASVSTVKIVTDVATVTIDSTAWAAMTTNASNSSVVLTVEKTNSNEDGTPLTYEVTAKADGSDIYSESQASGSVTISVPYSGTNPRVFYVDNGAWEDMNAAYSNTTLSRTTRHFSTFVVTDDNTAAAVMGKDVKVYTSLADAVTNASSGDTIYINKDITNSTTINAQKTLTFIGVTMADGSKPTISSSSGGIFSQTGNAQYTLENLELKATTNGQWYIYHSANTLTVNNCDFTMADGVTYTGNVIMGEGSPTNDNDYALKFTNNTITANSRAALTGIGNNSVITGNDINLISERHGTSESRTSIMALTAVDGKGKVTITGNTFRNANRVLAVDNSTLAASDLTYSENKFIDVRYAFELDPEKNKNQGVFDLNNNYYEFNGVVSAPRVEDASSKGSHFGDGEGSTEYIVGDGEESLVSNDVYYLQESMRPQDLNTYEPPYTGSYNYPVTLPTDLENGSITVAKEDLWATDGEKITITVTPDAGYMLDKLTITDKAGNEIAYTDNGDGTITFTMPASGVTIDATFVVDPDYEAPFDEPEEPDTPTLVEDRYTDVAAGAWYRDAVQYVVDNGIMTGTSATTFEPQTATTRAMIVSMLHRLEGNPAASGSDFSDVAAGSWYAGPVAWAAANGIVGGYEDDTFQPNRTITREELASILYRYAQYKGLDTSARADLSIYTDAPSAWAYDVMAWANAQGLITGRTATTIDAQSTLTRAECAAIFQRFLG